MKTGAVAPVSAPPGASGPQIVETSSTSGLSPRTESGIESASMKKLPASIKTISFLCLLLGLAQTLPAAANLFYEEVEIADESAEARQDSIARAFHKVLIKLTGNSKIKSHQGVPGLLKKSPDYVSQYRYRVEEISGDPQPGAESRQATRYIQIQFDQAAVDRALADLGIAIWEGTRPEVLLWLAYTQQGKPRLLDAETLPEAIPLLQQAAAGSGIPLQLPLMDLQDQVALSGADVWNADEPAVRQASRRYPHDVILTAKVSGSEGAGWNGSWVLYNRDEPRKFTRSGENLTRVLKRGMDRAADLLAEIYAPVASGEASAPVSVRILQVDTVGDYARVMDLLNRLGSGSRVSVKSMQADSLRVDVWIRGGRQALSNSLQLRGQLIPEPGVPEAGGAAVEELVFRLNH